MLQEFQRFTNTIVVFFTKPDEIQNKNIDKLYVSKLAKETIGRRGTDDLWNFGRP